MQKVTLALMGAFICCFFSAGKAVPESSKLKWMTLQEAQQAMQTEKRPVIIDLYTNWCGWCKVMDRKTYTNPHVIAYLQEKFYPVKLNAETREMLNWNQKNYQFNKDSQTNDFALFLTYGQLSYPTTVILPVDNSGPQPVPGYLEPRELELIVKYFGEEQYGKQPFEAYRKSFKAEW